MHSALESAIAELTLGRALNFQDAAAVEAWLDRHAVPDEDRAALRGSELERLLVYRKLVRSRLREALEAAIPRTIARLGPELDIYFDRFLLEGGGPKSRYLRDVTSEFLDFCGPLWRGDPAIPSYAADLARHEALHVEVAACRASSERELAELELDSAFWFGDSVRLARYSHSVHRLSDDSNDRTPPEARRCALLAYRDAEHEVRYLELTELAAAFVERWLAGASLREGIVEAARELGVELDESVLQGTASLLSDLSSRGVLLGPRRNPARAPSEDGTGTP